MTRTRHHEPINADCGSQHLTPLLIRRTKGQQTLVELLGEIETAKQAKPAQIALAWVSAQKPWIVPIPGTTKLNRLEENLGASVVTLSKADLAAIPAVLAKVAEQRDRYPAHLPGAGWPVTDADVGPGERLLTGLHLVSSGLNTRASAIKRRRKARQHR